jgi:NitT/TauT family transport system substrate-binding protein
MHRSSMHRRMFGKVAAGAVLGGLVAPRAWAQGQAKDVTLIIPNPSALNVFTVHTALGEGYFADEGLNIRVEAVDGSSAVLQAVSANQAQIGEPGPGPVLAARTRGVDVVFLYNLNPRTGFGLVVPEASSYQTVQDLKGKVIGVGTRDGAEVSFVRAILKDAAMEEDRDFTFLPVGDGGLAAAAFLRQEVEAYAAAASDAAILRSRGLPMRDITPEKFVYFFSNGFAALRPFIEQHPDVIEGFGRGIARASIFAQDPANKAKVLEHCARGNPQEAEDQELSNALLDALIRRQRPFDPEKGWGYQPPEHWVAWQESLVASGALKAPLPDLTQAYSNEFVPAWNKDLS